MLKSLDVKDTQPLPHALFAIRKLGIDDVICVGYCLFLCDFSRAFFHPKEVLVFFHPPERGFPPEAMKRLSVRLLIRF
jgi:hypothetical protein